MLLGIYLFAPVISPWLEIASKRAIELYLVLWMITGFIPYIHVVFPEIWGECYWNHTPMLYYFSGFLGYAILGCYIRRFYSQKERWDLPLGLILTVVGYAVTAAIFAYKLGMAKTVADLELSFSFDTINVALMTIGMFLMLKNIHFQKGDAWYARLVTDISLQTYGMYLVHIIILDFAYKYLNGTFASAYFNMPLIGVVAFAGSYVVIKLLSYVPKSKYLIG
jgi:surface polysaccharide O-acyltransferase-like enzyme